MTMLGRFTFAQKRRIGKVLFVLEELAKEDSFFADALAEYKNASDEQKISMGEDMLDLYNTTDFKCMDLRTAVILSSYSA